MERTPYSTVETLWGKVNDKHVIEERSLLPSLASFGFSYRDLHNSN